MEFRGRDLQFICKRVRFLSPLRSLSGLGEDTGGRVE